MEQSVILYNIDLLIEQIANNKPNDIQGKIIGQNIAASVVPSSAIALSLFPTIKQTLIDKGLSGADIISGGNSNVSQASMAAGLGTGLLGMAATSAIKPLLQKYQEKKYGITAPQDTRTATQKATDTGINVAKRVTGIGVGGVARAATMAALAPATAALGLGGIGASMMAMPAVIAASMIANKPLNALQQKIQQKRQLQQSQQG